DARLCRSRRPDPGVAGLASATAMKATEDAPRMGDDDGRNAALSRQFAVSWALRRRRGRDRLPADLPAALADRQIRVEESDFVRAASRNLSCRRDRGCLDDLVRAV